MTNANNSPIWDAENAEWLPAHLYYHEDLGRAVRRFVEPLTRSLVKSRLITSFHFLRYSLGGPHIRVRFRVCPSDRDRVLQFVQQTARRFLDREPSQHSMEEESIRRLNKILLAGDSNEDDDAVYPDNTLRIAPFRPEIDRYGGLELFRASLNFFTLSSLAAIEFLADHGDLPRSSQLAFAYQLLVRQALGFASSVDELNDLLRYGVDYWGQSMPKIVEKGDRVAESRLNFFLRLFSESLSEHHRMKAEPLSTYAAVDYLSAGASRLSEVIPLDDLATRTRIGTSQLHMTASRIGLSNSEEVYLTRLMTNTLDEIRTNDGNDFAWLRVQMTNSPLEASSALKQLLPPALQILSESPRTS